MWSSPVAWQVAFVMALQSSVFYLLITWLPSIEASHGVGDSVAGWHLFMFQVAGIFAGLVAGPILHRASDQRAVGMVSAGFMVVAMVGLILVPGLVVMWAVFAGISAGASLVVSLTLMSVRARTHGDAGRLSGMAQSVGYLIASLGPLTAGLLYEHTNSWTPTLVFAALLSVGQVIFAGFAGRDRFTHAE
jgi:CP family cyanate transporter-like MFS transporter